ncbi:MAG: hypothetical protein K5790_10155 [Nitrosopumilus sp.]|uniref:hypothetical protein n=1 Tax=Nitrosopumilus sp. TaxID=2024843 RepID=UPI00247B9B05|nr:hypothetical protein [Nitrosopumilus sp.]MCV0393631.1 hypothetical protein [Nitrosopumilus sp.]
MDEVIFADLPALPNDNLIFYQMVSEFYIPNWDKLCPDISIQSIVEKVLNPEIYPDEKPENIINSSETQEVIKKKMGAFEIISTKEDMDSIDKIDTRPIEQIIRELDNPKVKKETATKTPKEVIEMLGHKIDTRPKVTVEEEQPEPVQSEQKQQQSKEEHDLETMLTGELIALNKDVNQRFQWYNDIDFGHIRSIVEKKSLKKKIIKFETQTINSYMNKYKKLYDLLSHHGYEIEMLSSTEERDYETIFNEFSVEIGLLEKISLVDEMKMISSSWLPKEKLFSRRKRITPVISGKAKSSADKENS